ncbi:MAG: hypothetical protein ABW252_00330 [Polyangiales bacterium]
MTIANSTLIHVTRPANRRAARGFAALAAVLAMGACAADATSADTTSAEAASGDEAAAEPQAQVSWPWGGRGTTRPTTPARPTGTALLPTVSENGTFSGSLCSTRKDISTSSGAYTVQVDAPLDNSDNLRGSIRGTCNAGVDVTIPAGFQVLGPLVCARVILQSPEDDDASARVTLRASFGGTPVGTKTQALSGSQMHFVCATFPQIASQGCNASRATQAKLSVSVDLDAGPETFAQLSAIEGDFTYQLGAVWRSCAVGAGLPTAQAGQGCAGPNNLRCASGLRCELGERSLWDLGTCQ